MNVALSEDIVLKFVLQARDEMDNKTRLPWNGLRYIPTYLTRRRSFLEKRVLFHYSKMNWELYLCLDWRATTFKTTLI